MFADRISRMLILAGVIFLMIAYVLPTKDNFIVDVGGRKSIITRTDNPKIYWGTEAGMLVAAASLFSLGIYRGRKK